MLIMVVMKKYPQRVFVVDNTCMIFLKSPAALITRIKNGNIVVYSCRRSGSRFVYLSS